jgi:hypothetical protein
MFYTRIIGGSDGQLRVGAFGQTRLASLEAAMRVFEQEYPAAVGADLMTWAHVMGTTRCPVAYSISLGQQVDDVLIPDEKSNLEVLLEVSGTGSKRLMLPHFVRRSLEA